MKRTTAIMICLTLILCIVTNVTAEIRVTQIQTGKSGVALRSYPNGDKIASVHQYTYLDVLDQQDGWFYVYYDGQYGWVTTDSSRVTITRTENVTPTTESVIPSTSSGSVRLPGSPSWVRHILEIQFLEKT